MQRYTINEMFHVKHSENSLLLGSYTTSDKPISPYLDIAEVVDPTIARKYSGWIYYVEAETADDALTMLNADSVVWVRTHAGELAKVYEAFTSVFNPVENYDRYEETTTASTSSTTTQGTTTNNLSTTTNNTRTDDTTSTSDGTASNSNTGTSQTSPDDSENFYNLGKATDSGTSSSHGTVSNTGTVTDAGTVANTGTIGNTSTANVDGGNTTESHIHGNIGVVDAPTMIEKVYKFYGFNSYYDWLVDTIIRNTCVMVHYGHNTL